MDDFNAADDAETLKKAMKGFGKEIIIIYHWNKIMNFAGSVLKLKRF